MDSRARLPLLPTTDSRRQRVYSRIDVRTLFSKQISSNRDCMEEQPKGPNGVPDYSRLGRIFSKPTSVSPDCSKLRNCSTKSRSHEPFSDACRMIEKTWWVSSGGL